MSAGITDSAILRAYLTVAATDPAVRQPRFGGCRGLQRGLRQLRRFPSLGSHDGGSTPKQTMPITAVVAEALFGVTNFSGRLPITIGRTDREAAYETQEQYPGQLEETGVRGGIGRDPLCTDPDEFPPCQFSGPAPQRVVRYSEDLELDYRWYQSSGNQPLFPFGYGLSYTSFTYSDLDVTATLDETGARVLDVQFTVTNTGDRAGAAVPQVYLSLPDVADEPSFRLVGFDKIEIASGASERVSVLIEAAASNHPFSYFEPASDDLAQWADGEWVTPDGTYTVHVGESSAATPLTRTLDITFPSPAN